MTYEIYPWLRNRFKAVFQGDTNRTQGCLDLMLWMGMGWGCGFGVAACTGSSHCTSMSLSFLTEQRDHCLSNHLQGISQGHHKSYVSNGPCHHISVFIHAIESIAETPWICNVILWLTCHLLPNSFDYFRSRCQVYGDLGFLNEE